ncbi:MAG: peptide chain release factor N(5)-glutamine methyltransferase [bacterium]|nr:peptide chain release factor N(5)-glutamine methyltransferase [bacterium]MDW8163222.1 peptide chain release factor N(5)-glutamine methyltransferase [Candidatus Omnitrophota bacterium]
MNLLTLLKEGTEILKKEKIENPHLEVELILSHLMRIERYKIYTDRIEIPTQTYKRFLKLLEKRKKRIPLAYILKKITFYDSDFIIKKGIFIPRPETELLINTTIKIYNKFLFPKKVKILDIGTGCGNISVILAKNIKNCFITSIDISKKAIEVAKKNAELNDVTKKIKFLISDVFSNIKDRFDVIVSNPPYISRHEYENLDREVKMEPKRALIAGKDGLKIIKKILFESDFYLKEKGFLIIEIGYNQLNEIKKIIPSHLSLILIEKDLSNFDRILVFKKLKKVVK